MAQKGTDSIKKFFRNAIWIIVLIVAAIWLLNNYLDNRRKKQIKEREQVEAATELNNKISFLVSKHDVAVEWDNAIFDTKNVRVKPILTVELEKVWLTGRPILFVGGIKDIASIDASQYQITLEYPIIRGKVIFQNKIRLELKLPKSEGAKILAHYNKESFGFLAGVAAIALIERIETKPTSDSEDYGDILVGKGKCLEILYVSNLRDVKF